MIAIDRAITDQHLLGAALGDLDRGNLGSLCCVQPSRCR